MSSSTGSGTLYLIDGYAQFFRAYHAIRTPMKSRVTDEPTHMTFGFVGMLIRLLRNHAPEHLALVLDVAGDRGTFRSRIYPEYKANRDPPPSDLKPQVDRCLELLGHLGIPIYGAEEVEADDVIASIVRQMQAEKPELDIRIISKDKDLQQLLTERVSMLNLRKEPDPDEVIDVAWLREQRGIAPNQVVDMLALMGDTADNVPGVPGIGPKTAAQLIEAWGSIDGIHTQIDDEADLAASKRSIKGKRLENLLASREALPLSRELVTLKADCPIHPINQGSIDDGGGFDLDATRVDPAAIRSDALINDLRELGFGRLREEMQSWLREARGEPDATKAREEDAPAGSLFGNLDAGPTDQPAEGDYDIITDEKALKALSRDLAEAKRLAVDTETDGLLAPVVPLAGICLSTTPGTGHYIPVRAPEGEQTLDQDVVIETLRPILEDPGIPKFGHNIKYDINVLRNHGTRLAGIAGDTMVESYVLDATRGSHAMDALAERFLDRRCVPISEIIGRGKSQIVFSQAPLEKSGPYAAEDADVTLQLEDQLRPQLLEQAADYFPSSGYQ